MEIERKVDQHIQYICYVMRMCLREKEEQTYVSKCIYPHVDMTCSWIHHVVKFLTGDKRSNWTTEKVPTYRDFCEQEVYY